MYQEKRRTLFLVIDGAKAKLFESFGARGEWKKIKEWTNEAARLQSSDLADERPTRGRTIGSGARYAVEKISDHEKEEAAFLRARIDELNKAAMTSAYDQLVIAAPPRALGSARKQISEKTRSKCICMLDKDLTNFSDQELYDYFKDQLGLW